MFDFVKNIDYTLIRIITDVENDIKVRNGYTMVAMQSYCEMLLKYINSKENIVKSTIHSIGIIDCIFVSRLCFNYIL